MSRHFYDNACKKKLPDGTPEFKTLKGNLAYRRKLRGRAAAEPAFRKALVEMCRQDTLFFVGAFCYAFEPRNPPATRCLPFIPWAEQEEYFLALDDIWGHDDLWIEKRRAAGFSWCTLLKALKEVLFTPYTAVGLISKDEKAVDGGPIETSLMPKLDWELTMLPAWMVPTPKRDLNDHTLRFPSTHSGFTGYAATPNAMSGARYTTVLCDELAKWRRGPDRQVLDDLQQVTNCRVIGSSFFGRSGEFYEKVKHDPNLKVFVFDWRSNTLCNRGLYKVVKGEAVSADPNNPLTDDLIQQHCGKRIKKPVGEKVTLADVFKSLRAKGFEVEGTTRSPWYDGECLRSTGPQAIAQELDRDPQGTEVNFIDGAFLKTLLEGETATVREPKYRGFLDENADRPTFVPSPDGDLLIYCELDTGLDGKLHPPPGLMCALAADISHGQGASNSVACVLDRQNGEQVAEFASRQIRPAPFAHLCVALAKWFNGAYLSFDAHGPPGTSFAEAIINIGYGNVQRDRALGEYGANERPRIGFWMQGEDKSKAMGTVNGGGLREALYTGRVKVRSRQALIECGEYVIDENGKVVHLKSKTNATPDGRKTLHGDRVIALAIASHLVFDRPLVEAGKPAVEYPQGSFGELQAWADEIRSRARAAEEEFCYE